MNLIKFLKVLKNQNEWKNILILIDIRDAISKSKMIFKNLFEKPTLGFRFEMGL